MTFPSMTRPDCVAAQNAVLKAGDRIVGYDPGEDGSGVLALADPDRDGDRPAGYRTPSSETRLVAG